MLKMTPRERFWKTVNFEEPDRVPIQITGCSATSIAPVRDGYGPYGYDALCRFLKIKNFEDPYGDFGTINLDPRIKVRLHNDFEPVFTGDPGRIKMKENTEKHKMWGFVSVFNNGVTYFPDNLAPLKDKTSIKDIEKYEFWPDPDDPVYYDGVKEAAKKLKEDTQYVVIGDSGYAGIIDFTYHWLRGYSNWLSDPIMYPNFYIALKNKIAKISIEISKRFFSEVGEYIDMVDYHSDQGTQEGSMFSDNYYRKWIMPWQKKWVDSIKPLTKGKFFIHSCGSIYELIPSMIEAGFEIINPLQPLAKNMEPWRLKKSFYRKCVLHGGIDLQRLLPYSTVDEVVEGIKELIRVLAPGGGWIATVANNIPQDCPPENIYAAFDTVYKYGRYPINNY